MFYRLVNLYSAPTEQWPGRNRETIKCLLCRSLKSCWRKRASPCSHYKTVLNVEELRSPQENRAGQSGNKDCYQRADLACRLGYSPAQSSSDLWPWGLISNAANPCDSRGCSSAFPQRISWEVCTFKGDSRGVFIKSFGGVSVCVWWEAQTRRRLESPAYPCFPLPSSTASSC